MNTMDVDYNSLVKTENYKFKSDTYQNLNMFYVRLVDPVMGLERQMLMSCS